MRKWRKFTFGRFARVSLISIPASLGVLMMSLIDGKRRCRNCSTLYNTLKKLKARGGLTAELMHKVDVFFALDKLTEEEYHDLLNLE